MEILYIIIGVFISLVVFSISYTIRSIMVHTERIDDNEDDIDEILNKIENIKRDIDNRFEEVEQTIDNTQNDLSESIRNLKKGD